MPKVRRALRRTSDRPWTVAESVTLRRTCETLSCPEIRETYKRLLTVIDKGPPSTPAQIRAELAYHLKRWAEHPGLTKADRGTWGETVTVGELRAAADSEMGVAA